MGDSSMAGFRLARRAGQAVRLATAVVLAGALAACSMGNLVGGGAAPSASASLSNTSASPSEVAARAPSALPAIATECPPIKIRPGSEALFNYGGSRTGVGDPRQLHWQAIIENQSRNCVSSNGLITVKMGVVGRLLLGPAGSDQSMKLPLRFAIERDDVVMFSERYEIPVSITSPAQSAEFVKVVENVNVPYIGGENIVIWVGFDPQS